MRANPANNQANAPPTPAPLPPVPPPHLADILVVAPRIYEQMSARAAQRMMRTSREVADVIRGNNDFWQRHVARGFGVHLADLPPEPEGFYDLFVGVQSLLHRRRYFVHPQHNAPWREPVESRAWRYIHRHLRQALPKLYTFNYEADIMRGNRYNYRQKEAVVKSALKNGGGMLVTGGVCSYSLYKTLQWSSLPEPPVNNIVSVFMASVASGSISLMMADKMAKELFLLSPYGDPRTSYEDIQRRIGSAWGISVYWLWVDSTATFRINTFRRMTAEDMRVLRDVVQNPSWRARVLFED